MQPRRILKLFTTILLLVSAPAGVAGGVTLPEDFFWNMPAHAAGAAKCHQSADWEFCTISQRARRTAGLEYYLTFHNSRGLLRIVQRETLKGDFSAIYENFHRRVERLQREFHPTVSSGYCYSDLQTSRSGAESICSTDSNGYWGEKVTIAQNGARLEISTGLFADDQSAYLYKDYQAPGWSLLARRNLAAGNMFSRPVFATGKSYLRLSQ